MDSIYLDQQSSAYLAQRKINVGDSQAMQTAIDNALALLANTLTTGDPIDPGVVNFLVDCHNDSADGADVIFKFLMGDDELCWNYFQNLKLPATEALAPLLCNNMFFSGNAYGYLLMGLDNGKQLDAAPPALVLQTLTHLGGATDARAYAEHYLNAAAEKNLPLNRNTLDAYISMGGTQASGFIGQTLKNYPSYRPLMDVYRQLSPNGPDEPVRVYSQSQPPVASDLTLDDSTFFALTGAERQPVKGWASLALKQLQGAAAPLNKDDRALLNDLQSVAPQAAAWLAYEKLTDQLIQKPKRPSLDENLLEVLGNYDKGLMADLCDYQLASLYNAGAVNVVDQTNGIRLPGITTDLYGMTTQDGKGVKPKVGMAVAAYFPNSSSTQVFNAKGILTAEDVRRGFKRIQTQEVFSNPSDILPFQTALEGVSTLSPAVNVDRHQPLPKDAVIVPDQYGNPHYQAAASSYVYTNAAFSEWFAVIQLDAEIDAKFPPTVKVHFKISDGIYEWREVKATVDAQNNQLHLQVPLGVAWGKDASGVDRISVMYTVQDMAGDQFGPKIATLLGGSAPPAERYGLQSSDNKPKLGPLPAVLDQAAYEALKSVDGASAKSWYDKFKARGREGTPLTPSSGNNSSGDPATDFASMTLSEQIYFVQCQRAELQEKEIRSKLAEMQLQNDAIAKCQRIQDLLKGLYDRGLGKEGLVSAVITDGTDREAAAEINQLLSDIGFVLFDKIDPAKGQYNEALVTFAHLKDAIAKIDTQNESLSTTSQETLLKLQTATGKRNEAYETASALLYKLAELMKSLVANMR